jgi:hypothetical protein
MFAVFGSIAIPHSQHRLKEWNENSNEINEEIKGEILSTHIIAVSSFGSVISGMYSMVVR